MRALWSVTLVALLAGCAAPTAVTPAPTSRIDGALLDAFLQPIPNTPVYLLETNAQDTTSALGGFTFPGLAPGNYTLTAAHPGFKGTVRTLHVVADRPARIILQLSAIEVLAGEVRTLASNGTYRFPHPGQEEVLAPVPVEHRPDDIDAVATWSGTVGSQRIEFQLWDSAGELLGHAASEDGQVRVHVAMNLLSNGTRFVIPRIVFQSHVESVDLPDPEVDVRVAVNLYYGTTHDKLLGLA